MNGCRSLDGAADAKQQWGFAEFYSVAEWSRSLFTDPTWPRTGSGLGILETVDAAAMPPCLFGRARGFSPRMLAGASFAESESMNLVFESFCRWASRVPVMLLGGCLLLPAGSVAANEALGDKADPAEEVFFNERVLPIFREHCYACHSHAADKAKGGLVLDSRSGWSQGGESGPAVVPGKPQESLLLRAVRYEDLKMPPQGRLPAELVSHLERWVTRGAFDPRVRKLEPIQDGPDSKIGRKHWAFRPIADPSPPEVRNSVWPLHEIDQFILDRLERTGLQPTGDADRYTWLRRVHFDLTGLPPTPEQVREFAADNSPHALEDVVDRLLASRAFGERWARHWLDLVGYADQIGTSNSVFAQHAWRYRDYVIAAYQHDKPFDKFVREQIAGDLLPYRSVRERAENLVATGFLVLGDLEIVESDKAKLRVDVVDRQIQKTGKAFMAMTLDCARCHDHKFDPISQRDYYAIGGMFHSTLSVYTTNQGVWSGVHEVVLPETDAQRADRAALVAVHQERLQAMKTERAAAQERKTEVDVALAELAKSDNEKTKNARLALQNVQKDLAGRIGKLGRQIVHAEFFAPDVPKAHGVRDVARPADMQITIRGNPRALGEQIPRGVLPVVSDVQPEIAEGQSGRRELADWIVSRDNPLTARVAVNRTWQKLFGQGLVRTVDYFGLPGERPSHPELLDFLAAQFVREGWSHKKLIRVIVLSRTYRLDSGHDARADAVDPDNRLLWRMHRVRLDAEAVRDAMVFVSGRMKRSTGGSAIPLEYPENVSNLDPKAVNPASFRLAKWRPGQEFERTIYLPVIRDGAQKGPAKLRNVFDFPNPSELQGRRSVTSVPTQALFLMNSAIVKQHSISLAARVQKGVTDDTVRLEDLWLTVLNRPITAAERMEALAFLTGAGGDGWSELCHAMLASNEFLMRL